MEMQKNEIWIDNLPLPPSANEMYTPTTYRKNKLNKLGKKYLSVKVGRKKSPELEHFQFKCLSYKNSNLNLIRLIRSKCVEWVKQGYILRVDTWCAFEHSRIWTKDGQPQQLDADNRRKPLQDGLAKILDIDDKWFFAGNIEKVTCNSKESECAIIRILPHKARTLTEIRQLRNTAAF